MSASPITIRLMTAAAALLLSHAAFAADLYGEGYEDQPYAEGAYGEDTYEEYRDEARAPPAGSIKDGYPVPQPPPAADVRRYERIERTERVQRYARCLERWEIRDRLRHEGWSWIRPMGGDGRIVHIHARRFGAGRPFELTVDRCSGDVLAAHPRYLRSFAFGDRRPWHY